MGRGSVASSAGRSFSGTRSSSRSKLVVPRGAPKAAATQAARRADSKSAASSYATSGFSGVDQQELAGYDLGSIAEQSSCSEMSFSRDKVREASAYYLEPTLSEARTAAPSVSS